MANQLVFYVNGKKVSLQDPDPARPLASYLRHEMQLTGTKVSCGAGYCGACTVMTSYIHPATNNIRHEAVNACLLPLGTLHGRAVTTVEGIARTQDSLHAVQERLVASHGSQCGYCTPGMVMSMYALLRQHPRPTYDQVEHTLQGNLCRCTGYRPILDAFNSFCQDKCASGENCCQRQDSNACSPETTSDVMLSLYDPSQEPIFPSDLQLQKDVYNKSLVLNSPDMTWYTPADVNELLRLKQDNPHAQIAMGFTNLNIKGLPKPRVVIYGAAVKELRQHDVDESGVTVGAAVTISELEDILHDAASQFGECSTYNEILKLISTFGGKQTRNMATLGGHVASWSSSSTLLPLLVCARCHITVSSMVAGTRECRVVHLRECMEDNGLSLPLKPDEVIIQLHIRRNQETSPNSRTLILGEVHRARQALCPATVTVGLVVTMESGVVQDACFVFGGITKNLFSASQTAKKMITKEVPSFDGVVESVRSELFGSSSLDADMEHRMGLVTASLFKFWCQLTNNPDSDLVEVSPRESGPVRGTQVFTCSPHSEHSDLGRPIPHYAATDHVTGAMEYTADKPHVQGELAMALVMSSHAHARIVRVDPSAALSVPGVVEYVTAGDVPASNDTGVLVHDEQIFGSEYVHHVGTVIGGVVADTYSTARQAAKLVHVEYEPLPHILTIQEAIDAKSFYGEPETIVLGDVTEGFQQADAILEGTVHVGGQSHFALELNSALAVPQRGRDVMEVWVCTHRPYIQQSLVASALGVHRNRVSVRVKYIGGSFGGKIYSCRRYALPAAVAAHKLQRAVRCSVTRAEDSLIVGGRHPMMTKYKVGYMKDGRITALSLDLFCNGGSSCDVTKYVLRQAASQISGGYNIPNMVVKSRICRTNIPTPTAFRGFGVPQAHFVTSSVVSQVARALKMPLTQVQQINLCKTGDLTVMGQTLKDCSLPACWKKLLHQADYEKRRLDVQEFNRNHRLRKRGLAVVPVNTGLIIMKSSVNQGGCLVHVYTDGSVLIAHGGVELGQGIHTKVMQIASRTLGVPVSMVHVSETSTTTVPNAYGTAASIGTDLYGWAVHKACETLNERLAPIKAAQPDASWPQLVSAAYERRVNLSVTGFREFTNYGADEPERDRQLYGYFICGAGCSEVELDLMTGTHVILRSDVVMDVGDSINPAIDIGQIEGAFVQGVGLHTLEEVRWSQDGRLLSGTFQEYNIPSVADIPREFNVTLLRESVNKEAVYSAKGIGEPPLVAGSSVLFAVQDALHSALDEHGLTETVCALDSPATTLAVHAFCMKHGLNKTTA